MNRTGGVPPIAEALHVIGVPTVTGSATLDPKLVIRTGAGPVITKLPVPLHASRAAVDPVDLTQTCNAYVPTSAAVGVHEYVFSAL